MKKALILLFGLILAFCFSSCGGNNDGSDGDNGGGGNGVKVPYLSDMKLGIKEIDNAPDKKGALAIAKKYYDMCEGKVETDLKFDFWTIIDWEPDFSGAKKDSDKAVSLSAISAVTQRLTDAAYFYTAFNAAAFEIDPESAAGTINLATAISQCYDDLSAKEVSGLNRDEFYKDSLSMYCHALIVCNIYEGNHIISALISVASVLCDLGEVSAAQKVLETVIEIDKECLEAFNTLLALYLATGQNDKAAALSKKFPKPPIMLGLSRSSEKIGKEASEVTLKQTMDPPQEAEQIEQYLKEAEDLNISSLADFYDDIDSESAAAIRQHVKDVTGNMKKFTPPNVSCLTQYSYDGFAYKGGNGFDVLHEVEGLRGDIDLRADKLDEELNKGAPYLSRFTKLVQLAEVAFDFANPQDISLQFQLISILNAKIGAFGTCMPILTKLQRELWNIQTVSLQKSFEIDENYRPIFDDLREKYENGILTEEQYKEALKPWVNRVNKEQHNYWNGVFGEATSMAVKTYGAVSDAVKRCNPEVMTCIMMISDAATQQYFLNNWEYNVTAITSYALDLLCESYRIISYYEIELEETQMLDLGTAFRDSLQYAPGNAKIERNRQTASNFYNGVIDENSKWYKDQNAKYGRSVNLILVKYETNDFLTKTYTKLDLGAVSGELKTVTNHLRETTTWDGSIKAGAKVNLGGGASGSVGAKGSVSLVTDANGNIVPGSVQWKAGIEAQVSGGPLTVGGGIGTGSDGGYAELIAEVSSFGDTVKTSASVEVTATRGTKLSGEISISGDALKDKQAEMSGLKELWENAQKAAEYTRTKRSKLVWNGEYGLPW